MYDILSDIISHCNGFIRTARTQTVRTRRPWPRARHSPFQLNLHTTLFADYFLMHADTAIVT